MMVSNESRLTATQGLPEPSESTNHRPAMRRAALTSVLLAAASLTSLSCRRVALHPGTGGLRVHIRGGSRDFAVHVWIGDRYSAGGWTPRHLVVRGSEALFVDLPPGGYRIAANDEQGRGGYFGTFGGRDWVGVNAGQVADESVSLDSGLHVRGRVIDAQTRAPIENVYVAPPTRAASPTWPVALPWFWSATDASGAFFLGGLPSPGNESRPSSPIWFQRPGYVDQSIALPRGGAEGWTVELVRAAQE